MVLREPLRILARTLSLAHTDDPRLRFAYASQVGNER
jgi:hypothetical protein